MQTNLWTKVNTLSFKTKSTLVAIALGIIPIATIGTINYLQISNSSQQQTIKTQKERAASVADKLNRFIFERTGDVTVLSSLPIFADSKVAAINSTAQKSELLDRFATIYNVYDSIAVFDRQGNPLVQSKGAKLDNHFDRKYFQAA